MLMTTMAMKMAMNISIVTQIGENTATQDHVMTPQSLSAMNKMVRSPGNPMPDDEFDWLMIGLSLYVLYVLGICVLR